MVDITWSGIAMTEAVVRSHHGFVCRLRGEYKVFDMQNKPVKCTQTDGVTCFDTSPGKAYKIYSPDEGDK